MLLTLGQAVLWGQTPRGSTEQHLAAAAGSGAFKAGEKLQYEIRYGIAKCAVAEFTTTDTVIEGRRHFHHKITGTTTGLIGAIYPLTDTYHSYTDAKSDLPVIAIRDVHEQSYRDYKVDRYDRKRRADSVVIVRETGDEVVVSKHTHDLVSVAYYLRNRVSRVPLTKGKSFEIPTFFNAEYYPMQIRYEGREVIKTRFGNRECYRFVPMVQEGDLFKEREAITVWFAADGGFEVMRVRFKLFLGSMYCDLVAK